MTFESAPISDIPLVDADYVLTEGGMWLGVKNLSIRIRETDEGVSVSFYTKNREDEDSISETWVLFSEADPDTFDLESFEAE